MPMGPIRSASRAETLPPAIRPVCSVLVIWHAGSGPRLELGTAYLAVPRLWMFCSKAVETGKTTAEPPLTRGLTHRGGGRCESAEPDPHHVSGLGAKVPSRQKSALLESICCKYKRTGPPGRWQRKHALLKTLSFTSLSRLDCFVASTLILFIFGVVLRLLSICSRRCEGNVSDAPLTSLSQPWNLDWRATAVSRRPPKLQP
jgi:hypothetical protein